MFEIFACLIALVVFAAVWLAVYKFGGLDWLTDASLAGATKELSAAHLALDGEMHGAAARLSPVAADDVAPRGGLFNALAGQASLSVPAYNKGSYTL